VNVEEIISSGLLELYAAGIASDAEQQQVEAWRQQYPEVAAELNAIEAGLEQYAQANAVAPAASVKEKLFAQINNTPAAAPVVSLTPGQAQEPAFNFWKWAAAASVVLLIGSAVLNVTFYTKSETAETKLAEAEQQLSMASAQTEQMLQYMDVVRNPYSKPVKLDGQPQLPDATAKIFWMTNTGDVMVDASNLPDAPAGKQYQFWAIVDGKPVDGGLIITNDQGKKFRMQKMKSFGRAEAFAISLENEGGNPTPTDVVSVGKI
jgi:anti-sigma-K factor RskA